MREPLLVLAPHPDDEVLGAAGAMDAVLRSGGRVQVLVVNDGGRGVNRTRARDLVAARREETTGALARLGVGSDAVHFLGYPDARLAGAWGERWREPEGGPSGAEVLDAVRTALRTAAPGAVVLPLSVDEHPDHRALGRLALLAVLAEYPAGSEPALLGYLVHANKSWPACHAAAARGGLPRPTGCAAFLPWERLPLEPSTVVMKRALIEQYRSQVGRGGTLLRYAAADEPFATGMVVRANRAMSPWRPGVRRGPCGIRIEVPSGACGTEPGAGDRIRLRYLRAGQVEERLVMLDGAPSVVGGPPGGVLAPTADITIIRRDNAVLLALDAARFADVSGAVIEVLRAGGAPIPAWLLRW